MWIPLLGKPLQHPRTVAREKLDFPLAGGRKLSSPKMIGSALRRPTDTICRWRSANIRFVTNALSVVGNVERSAPGLEKMKAKTKKLRDAAQTLLKEAGWPAPTEMDTSFEALTDGLATAVKEYANDHFQFLLMVYAVLTGCNLMHRAWESDGGLREGWIWDAWAQSISEIMQYHGLPV